MVLRKRQRRNPPPPPPTIEEQGLELDYTDVARANELLKNCYNRYLQFMQNDKLIPGERTHTTALQLQKRVSLMQKVLDAATAQIEKHTQKFESELERFFEANLQREG